VAITYQTAGVVEATTASSRSYTLPTGIAAGDLIVILVGMKPSTANTGDVGPVSGYTEVTPQVFGGGYGATLGADTGNTLIAAFARVADGTEGTTRTVPFTGQNVVWVWGARLSNATGLWDVAGATGEDTTAGSVSVTFTSDPGVEGGDYVIAAMCIPTDVTTPSQFSAEALSQTGVTYGTVTEVAEPDSSGGNDIGGFIVRAAVSSGTSSAAPVLTATAGGTTTNVRGPAILVRAREVSAGGPTLVDVLQASETDLAQPAGRSKTRAVGLTSETDTAQALGRVKARAVGQATETDTAQALGRVKARAVGQATETDLAQPAGRRKLRAVGLSSETDLTQPVARRKSKTLGLASETDTAQTITKGARQVAVGLTTETDLAQPAGRRKVRTLGLVTETDLAQPITEAGALAAAVGLASETDLAQPVARSKRRATGLATEVDTALAITPRKVRAVGLATEVDAALGIARRKARAAAQATETDAALPPARRKLRGAAMAAETDAALAAGRRKARALGFAVESDVALPVVAGSATAAPVGPALEADTALPAGRVKRRAVGLLVEVDDALVVVAVVVGPAAPPDVAGSWWTLKTLLDEGRAGLRGNRGQAVACALCGTPLEADAHGVAVCPDDGWPWPASRQAHRLVPRRVVDVAVACERCGTPLVTGPDGRLACPDDGWRP